MMRRLLGRRFNVPYRSLRERAFRRRVTMFGARLWTGSTVIGILLGLFAAAVNVEVRAADDHAVQAGRVQISAVRLGFAGHFKVGYWTPVWVTLKCGPGTLYGHLELETVDSDGVPVVFRSDGENAIHVPESGEITIEAAVKFGRPRGELHAVWRGSLNGTDAASTGRETSAGKKVVHDAGRRAGDSDLRSAILARRTFLASESGRVWPHSQLLVVTIGTSVGVEDSARFLASDASQVTAALVIDADELPTKWFAYEGVDVVVLSTSRRETTDRLADERFSALDQWLKLGGRLVWSVGIRGGEVFAADSRFAAWSPGKFVEVGPLARTSALEAFAGSSERLESKGEGGRRTGRLDMCVLRDVRGRIDAPEGGVSSGDGPMVIRYPVGLGQAVLATLDLDQPPLSQWAGRPQVLSRMFQHAKENVSDSGPGERSGQLTHLGFDDLSGQLRGALDQYPGLTFVSFSWVAVILVAYILLIGPGDYFLLRAWKRPHWTWGTLGLVVVLFVGLAYYLNGRWKDARLRLNQVDVVDVDMDSGLVRGTHWANLYSPRSDLYDISMAPVTERVRLASSTEADDGRGELLSWQGLPGRGLGGLGAATATAAFDQPYSLGASGRAGDILHLPVAVAGTKSLGARWWRQATLERADDKGDLSATSLEEQLQGECVNPLPVALSEWFLCFGNWLYRGDRELAPGELISISQFPATRYLDWHLARRKVNTEHKDVTTPWDQASFDVGRIVEMMMFHESAGGSTYTRLGHRYQGYLDLTDHLRTGRAILVGRSGAPAVRLRRSEQPLDERHDQQVTYYRVVFPVTIKKQVPGGGRR